MPPLVNLGASLQCSFGAAPSSLIVALPMVTAEGPPAANITDHVPIMNIPPFGMCSSPANPTVATATTAAAGVLTPMPCVPVVPAPWAPGSATVMLRNMPALNQTCQCMCAWGGVIAIVNAGTTKTMVS
ncbi:MAG: DUF4280 domain-containing protein [Deltaproteobacteria bacterium]|nr:DUF4280 domain-containing protein [Deltaproteobacteria bacterium]